MSVSKSIPKLRGNRGRLKEKHDDGLILDLDFDRLPQRLRFVISNEKDPVQCTVNVFLKLSRFAPFMLLAVLHAMSP